MTNIWVIISVNSCCPNRHTHNWTEYVPWSGPQRWPKNRCENNKNWTSDKEPLNKGLMCDGWWWQISVIMCPTTVSQSLYSHLLFPNICISSASITSVKSENAILYSFIIAAATVVNSLTNKQKTVNYSCWDFFKKLNLSSFILPGLQHIGEFSCLVPMICFMTHTHTHTPV